MQEILGTVHHTRERRAVRSLEYRRCVEAGIRHGQECRIAREPKPKFIQQRRREGVRFRNDTGTTDGRVVGAAQATKHTCCHGRSLILRPASRQMVFLAQTLVDLDQAGVVEGGGSYVGNVVDSRVRARRIWSWPEL